MLSLPFVVVMKPEVTLQPESNSVGLSEGTKAKPELPGGNASGLVPCPGAGWLLMQSLGLGIKDTHEKDCMENVNATWVVFRLGKCFLLF